MPTRSSRDPTRSPEFQPLRRRLTQWRATRPHLRAPMPEPLWAEAVVLAERHGVSATARALGVGHEGLTRRVRGQAVAPAPVPTFVEVPVGAVPAAATWVLEFQGPDGRVLRVQTPPWPMLQLVALGRAMWSPA